MPFMPVQIFIQAAKMEEEIFNQSKITKNESKNIKRRIERIKRIFLFSDSRYWNFTVTSAMRTICSPNCKGIEKYVIIKNKILS